MELADEELVCIFPEGKITSSGEMNEFKQGIVRIIEETPHVAVIPIALSGLWGSTFSRKESSLFKRLSLRELLRTVRLNIGNAIEDDRRKEPQTLQSLVLTLRGNWQ